MVTVERIPYFNYSWVSVRKIDIREIARKVIAEHEFRLIRAHSRTHRRRFHQHIYTAAGHAPIPVGPQRIGNLAERQPKTHVRSLRRRGDRIDIAPVVEFYCRCLVIETAPFQDALTERASI